MKHEAALFNTLLNLPSLRQGIDFFALETLLNQRVGVERATAAALAIHCFFGRSALDLSACVGGATNWPYDPEQLRRPGKSLFKLVADHLKDLPEPNQMLLEDLPDGIIGALASLGRYHDRSSVAFDQLREVTLEPDQLRGRAPTTFRSITGLRFPEKVLPAQLSSAATVLEMSRNGARPTIRDLMELERVGHETADTLLLYLFKTAPVIVDDYLKRILFRHIVLDKPNTEKMVVERIASPFVIDNESAHRLHARANEIGVLHCFATEPSCEDCPLVALPRRN